MLHWLAVGLCLRKIVERRSVVPAADRELPVIRAKHGLPSDAQPAGCRTRSDLRAIQEGNFGDDQRAVAGLKDAMAAVGPVDRNTVEHRDAHDNAFLGLEGDAHAGRGVGKDRRPFHAALSELRPDAERAVEEQSGRLQAIELAIEVVEACEHGSLVSQEVLLNPGFVELHRIGRGDCSHLGCPR